MKDKERYILNKVNQECNIGLQEADYEYSRFDAYNDEFIAEIKFREKDYKWPLIEFDKFSNNLIYAKITNKQFIYAVRMEYKIYIFNVTKLYKSNYNFNWTWRDMPITTNFNSDKRIQKLIGYININEKVKECIVK